MNLEKLYATQKILCDRIGYQGEDKFDKLVLAFFVELGECSQDWRGFKFWSKNQRPRTKASRNITMMEEDMEYYNPLLEEYVDGLHFLLELGIEIGYDSFEYDEGFPIKTESVVKQFNATFDKLGDFSVEKTIDQYEYLFDYFAGLGYMLGFTWEEVEQAYFDKNKINHARQDSGTY